MPYRAMFSTIVTVALALLAVGMWIRAITPAVVASQAATQAAGKDPATLPAMIYKSAGATTRAEGREAEGGAVVLGTRDRPSADTLLKGSVNATLLLAFLTICFLLIVGFFATFREWVKFVTSSRGVRKAKKTQYVDAWKLAGERMEVKGEEGSGEG